MPPLPAADWSAALDRMTAALRTAQVELDRYEAEHRDAFDVEQAPAVLPVLAVPATDRLARAESYVQAIEAELRADEEAVGGWAERFAEWQAGG